MNVVLLQWGLFCFSLGLFLALPVSVVFYLKKSKWKNLFTNPKKLLSSHLDYLMQSFGLGLVYLLGLALKVEFSPYIAGMLMYGAFFNPTILLLEATPVYRSGIWGMFWKFLRGTSPISLLISWFYLAWKLLPGSMLILFLVFALFIVIGMWTYRNKE